MAKKYTIKNTNIFYNNKFYRIGEEITLTDSVAAKLVDVITPVVDDTTKTATKNTKTKNNTDETGTQTPDNTSAEDNDTKTDESQDDKTNGGNA